MILLANMNHTTRALMVVLWAGWIAYPASTGPSIHRRKNSSWRHRESYVVNKNPLVRALNALVGILVLAIGLAVAFGAMN